MKSVSNLILGVIAFANTVGLQISVSYAVDSFREIAGESIVTVILIRNTMSFAVSYGVTPWVLIIHHPVLEPFADLFR
jgi:hypothetical protein